MERTGEYSVVNEMIENLSSIIENAIQHGVSSRYDGKGVIRIRIRRNGDKVVLTIFDNGAGISREKLKEIRSRISQDVVENVHIGLFNTALRLRKQFGPDAIRIDSREGFGTRITILLPAGRAHETETF